MFKRAVFSVLGAVAALSIGIAGAYFAAQVQVSDSVIRAGTVAVSTVPTTAPLAISSLAPGQSAVRPLTIANDGSLASDVVVTAKKSAGITAFWDALQVRVSANDVQLYDGALSALRTTPIRLDPGARGDLRFEVSLPAEATDTLAGDYVKVALNVDAEQTH